MTGEKEVTYATVLRAIVGCFDDDALVAEASALYRHVYPEQGQPPNPDLTDVNAEYLRGQLELVARTMVRNDVPTDVAVEAIIDGLVLTALHVKEGRAGLARAWNEGEEAGAEYESRRSSNDPDDWKGLAVPVNPYLDEDTKGGDQ